MSTRPSSEDDGGERGSGDLAPPADLTQKRKKRKSSANSTSRDSQEHRQPAIKDIVCNCEVHYNSYRIVYHVTATGKCFGSKHNLTRLKINATAEIMQSAQPWKAMKEKTIEKVNEAIRNGSNLNVFAEGIGLLYMCGDFDSLWENLYAKAESKMLSDKLERLSVSERRVAGHEARGEEVLEGEWEEGVEFPNASQKSRAKKSVLVSLEKSSGKSTKRAESILSGVLTDLAKESSFNEEEVISDNNREKIDYVDRVMEHASNAVKSLKGKGGTIPKAAARLLTGFSAISIPQDQAESDDDEKKPSLIRKFMKEAGLNPRAKYVKEGLKNRAEFDKVIARHGEEIQ
ncbi:hypothetical protein THAOC_32383, partial [Thalassiosira oceanica]